MSAPEPTAEDRDLQIRLGSWARSLLARAGRARPTTSQVASLPAAVRRPMSVSTGGTLALVQRLARQAGGRRMWQPEAGPALPRALDRFAAGVAGRYELNARKHQPQAAERKEQESELVLAFPASGGVHVSRQTTAPEVVRETADFASFLSSEPPGAPGLGGEPASPPVTFGPPPWERQAGGPAARMAQRRAGVRPVSRVEEITPASGPPAVTDPGPAPSEHPPAAGESESSPAGTAQDEEGGVAPAPAVEFGAARPPLQRRQEPPRPGEAGPARPAVRRPVEEAPAQADSRIDELPSLIERAEPRTALPPLKDGGPVHRESAPQAPPLPPGPPAAPAVQRLAAAGTVPAPGNGEAWAAGEGPARTVGEEPASREAGDAGHGTSPPPPQPGRSGNEDPVGGDVQGARGAPSLQSALPPGRPGPFVEGRAPRPAVQRQDVAPAAHREGAGPDAATPREPTTIPPKSTVHRRAAEPDFQEERGRDPARPAQPPAAGSGEDPVSPTTLPEPGIRRRPLEGKAAPAADAGPEAGSGEDMVSPTTAPEPGIRRRPPEGAPAPAAGAGPEAGSGEDPVSPTTLPEPGIRRRALEGTPAPAVDAGPEPGIRRRPLEGTPVPAPGAGPEAGGGPWPQPEPPAATEPLAALPEEGEEPRLQRQAGEPQAAGDVEARLPEGAREGLPAPPEAAGRPAGPGHGRPRVPPPPPSSPAEAGRPVVARAAMPQSEAARPRLPGADAPAEPRISPDAPEASGRFRASVEDQDEPADLAPVVQRRRGGAEPIPGPAVGRGRPPIPDEGGLAAAPDLPVQRRGRAKAPPGPASGLPAEPPGSAGKPIAQRTARAQARSGPGDEMGAQPGPLPEAPDDLPLAAVQRESAGAVPTAPVDDGPGAAVQTPVAGEVRPSPPAGKAMPPPVQARGPGAGPDQAPPAAADTSPAPPPAAGPSLRRRSAELPLAQSGTGGTSFTEERAPGRQPAAGLEGDGQALQPSRSRDLAMLFEPEKVGPEAQEQAEDPAAVVPSLRRRAGGPPPEAGEERAAAWPPGGEPRRDEARAAPRAADLQAGAGAVGGQARSGPRALPPESPAPAGGVQRQAGPGTEGPAPVRGQPAIARQPQPPAARSREPLPLVERRPPEGGAGVQAGRDQAAGHALPGISPAGPAAAVARFLDGPLPLAPRVIQRQTAAAEAASDVAAPVETVQRAVEDVGAEEPVPSLEELARRVYPFVKRLLAIERERLPR